MIERLPIDLIRSAQSERVHQRLEAIRATYLANNSVERAFEDTGLFQLSAPRGEVRSVIGQGEKKPVLVETGEGIFAETDREIVTEEMFNCVTVIIVGPRGKEMVHMTPGGDLPYREYRFSDGHLYSDPKAAVERVVQPLRELGEPLDKYRALIICNRADATSESSKFNYPAQEAAWKQLAGLLRSAGLGKSRVVETSLIRTIVYHTPDKPNEVLVIGRRAMYNKQGEVVTNQNEVGAVWVPIDGQNEFEFLERPSDIKPGQADDIINI